MDITYEINIQGTDIKSDWNVQGRTLQVRVMRLRKSLGDGHYKWEECTMDGHYI